MKRILTCMLVIGSLLLVSCTTTGTTQKQNPPINIPTYQATQTEIKMDAQSSIEYSIDEGATWISDDVVFTGLEPNTEYKILYRTKASDTLLASDSVELKITTKSFVEEGIALDKILVIGNQNTLDVAASLFDVLTANEIEGDLILGVVANVNESLQDYVAAAQNNTSTYTFEKYSPSNDKVTHNNQSLFDAITNEPWDLIVLEQTNGFGGILKEYKPYLDSLVTYIKSNRTNENLDIAFHMPWAYHPESTLPEFSNYRSDQIRMYNNIVSRMTDSVLNNDDISRLIPTGSALQNLRTSVLRNDMTLEDGERLNSVGKLTVSLMWIETLFDHDIENLDVSLFELDENTVGAAMEAVINAGSKPLEVTRSTQYSNPYKDKLYMLSIGNSFTQDAYVYMAQMLLDIGIKDFVIGYLYRGGESLSGHLNHIKNNTQYEQYRIWNNSTTMVEVSGDKTIKRALAHYEWDIVTVQQVSSDSGVSLSFVNTLDPLMKLIKEYNQNDANTTYGYHMTWAYTDHWEFGRYNHDQIYMYERIVEATLERVATSKYIDFIIPVGTAVQNLRATSVGDNVTRDGYHLNGIGQFTAGLTWVKFLTNTEVENITTLPVGVNVGPNIGLINRAVNDAYDKPYVLS